MIPEALVLLVLNLTVVEHSLCMLLDLLILLKLGLKGVMLEGILRWYMLGISWLMR